MKARPQPPLVDVDEHGPHEPHHGLGGRKTPTTLVLRLSPRWRAPARCWCAASRGARRESPDRPARRPRILSRLACAGLEPGLSFPRPGGRPRGRAGGRARRTPPSSPGRGDGLVLLLREPAATLRSRWTMQRYHAAPWNTSAIACTRPSWSSDTTHLTPVTPRLRRPRRNAFATPPTQVDDVETDEPALTVVLRAIAVTRPWTARAPRRGT